MDGAGLLGVDGLEHGGEVDGGHEFVERAVREREVALADARLLGGETLGEVQERALGGARGLVAEGVS